MFLSEVLEKAVFKLLVAPLLDNSLFIIFQHAISLHSLHSTKDAGECSIVVLLDLSAVFNTVDPACSLAD